MAIESVHQMVDAMCNYRQKIPINKPALASQIAGAFSSYWRIAGYPQHAGAVPTSAAACYNGLNGSTFYDNADSGLTNYLAKCAANSTLAQSFELHDRIAHMGGLSGTSTSSQTVGIDIHTSGLGGTYNITQRKGDSDFGEVQWWIEHYIATGSTARVATISYTNDAGTSKTVAVDFPASQAAGRLIRIIPDEGDGNIRSIESVQLSATTGTAGSWGVTVTRPLYDIFSAMANQQSITDWTAIRQTVIPDDSCLVPIGMPHTTSALALGGAITIIQG